MSEGQPSEGGTHKGIGVHLPMWGWALVVGTVGGLIWFVRHQANATTAAAATTAATDTTGPTPIDIVPVDQGGDDSSDAQLLAAINKLQGSLSTPKPRHRPTPTPKPPVPSPTPTPTKNPPPPPPPPTPTPQAPTGSVWVTIKSGSGSSFASIAQQYGHSWQDLWNYQLAPGVRPPDTQAKLRKEGPTHSLFGGSSVAIPASWTKK